MNDKYVNPTKIIHFAKYYYPSFGGIETATRNLAETAVALGYQVYCNANSTSLKVSKRSYILNGVHIYINRIIFKIFSTSIGFGMFFQKIPNNAIIHIHMPNPLAEIRILILLFFSKRKKVFPFLHAIPVGQGKLGKVWFKIISAKILDRVEYILISDAFIINAFPILKKWESKFLVMPFFTNTISSRESEQLIPLRVRSKFVVAVGRLVPYKGYDILIKAWKKLREDPYYSSYQLKIIGDGQQRIALENLVRELNLEDSIEFMGNLTDSAKSDVLMKSSLFVAPSTTNAETFGISILEAMGYALPVIVSNLNTGVSVLARNGKCGAVVELGSVESLYKEMHVLLKNTEIFLRSYGFDNLEFVQRFHTKEILYKKYDSFLRDQLSTLS